ncbi:hypothetical protein SAMN04488501_111122 [Clostridium homopropionicum]|nr:hypothetical protein SAMN04488501_111122 [Clostridium homopropionicum]
MLIVACYNGGFYNYATLNYFIYWSLETGHWLLKKNASHFSYFPSKISPKNPKALPSPVLFPPTIGAEDIILSASLLNGKD